MSLRGAPLLYTFLETSRLNLHRKLFEQVLELPLIEVEPHLPHHRHGVTKYDAGRMIISLNLSGPSRFRSTDSDGLFTVFSVAPPWRLQRLRDPPLPMYSPDGYRFTDSLGHHFGFHATLGDDQGHPVVEELRLTVRDIEESVRFYRDLLDLELLEWSKRAARFGTGSVPLALVQDRRAVDGRRPRVHSYLLVFHTPDIHTLRTALIERGLEFKGPRVGFSEIGGTIRFDDPSGNRFCLYTPSEECLTWGSGPKVIEIAGGLAGAH